MSARDELAEIIQDCGEYIPGSHADDYVSPVKAADAILAAGYSKPRTVTTVEELDALRVGAVIRTSGDEDHFDPRVAVKTSTLGMLSFWAVAGDEDGFESSSDELDDLPATVLHEPKSA